MDNSSSKHCITLNRREKLQATGVSDVLSFDEENIVAQTDIGILIIRGENLHILSLNLEKGALDIEGIIENIGYDDNIDKKGSLLSRIFK
ncbi:MAG: sporulation protein YabP [Lachnospirales bacterium]